ASFLNKRISKTITTQNYARSALLWLLLGVTGTASGDMEIGRPNEGLYLSGASVSEIERESVRGTWEFTQRVQGFKTSNTQVTGVMGTMPTVQNPTTSSQDVALQNAAAWRWCMNIDTPILIWNSTLSLAMAKSSSDGGVAVGTMLEESMQVAI